MVNGKSSLEKIKDRLTKEKESLKQEEKTLRELESTDEIRSKLERIDKQIDVLNDVISMIDEMADDLGSFDLFLEKIKQYSPVITSLVDSYSGEISPIFNNVLTALQKIDSSALADAPDLYKARAEHIKLYYDALTKAGLPPEVAAKVVARQGAPYSLMTMLGQVFERFVFQVEIND